MDPFRFYHPIEVRYGDLDPQGHLNNAKYLTYMEQARIKYIHHLDLWDGDSFLNIGIILADFHITFRSAIQFKHQVQVGVRVTRLGNKSLDMSYRLVEAQTGEEFATGSTVLVAYDYRSSQTAPIPDDWRRVIREFEGLETAVS
jgi:acyl-CoA thioester hydrolase